MLACLPAISYPVSERKNPSNSHSFSVDRRMQAGRPLARGGIPPALGRSLSPVADWQRGVAESQGGRRRRRIPWDERGRP